MYLSLEFIYLFLLFTHFFFLSTFRLLFPFQIYIQNISL